MKIKLFFCCVLFFPVTSHTMLTTFFLSKHLPLTASLRPITYKYPNIEDVYRSVNSKKIPSEIKRKMVSERLLHDPDLSAQERKTLHLLRDIASLSSPKKCFSSRMHQKLVLFDIIEQNDNELLRIGLSHGLHAYVNDQNSDKNSPLYIASRRPYPSIANTLIQSKANPNLCNEMNRTAVIGAIIALLNNNNQNCNDDYIQVLKVLQQAQADLLMTDDSNKTASDYVLAALHKLQYQRQRTMHNEQADECAFYQKIAQILEEWY